jgi:hypothetical protein
LRDIMMRFQQAAVILAELIRNNHGVMTMTTLTASINGITPQFTVPDVVATAEYYRDVWGFTISGY